MKTLFFALVAGLFAITLTSCSTTHSKEVTMTGTVVCGKCKLHETAECQNVLQVMDDGQTVNYYMTMNKVSKDFHNKICTNDGEKATVTGTVMEKDGKQILTPTSITPAGDEDKD